MGCGQDPNSAPGAEAWACVHHGHGPGPGPHVWQSTRRTQTPQTRSRGGGTAARGKGGHGRESCRHGQRPRRHVTGPMTKSGVLAPRRTRGGTGGPMGRAGRRPPLTAAPRVHETHQRRSGSRDRGDLGWLGPSGVTRERSAELSAERRPKPGSSEWRPVHTGARRRGPRPCVEAPRTPDLPAATRTSRDPWLASGARSQEGRPPTPRTYRREKGGGPKPPEAPRRQG